MFQAMYIHSYMEIDPASSSKLENKASKEAKKQGNFFYIFEQSRLFSTRHALLLSRSCSTTRPPLLSFAPPLSSPLSLSFDCDANHMFIMPKSNLIKFLLTGICLKNKAFQAAALPDGQEKSKQKKYYRNSIDIFKAARKRRLAWVYYTCLKVHKLFRSCSSIKNMCCPLSNIFVYCL